MIERSILYEFKLCRLTLPAFALPSCSTARRGRKPKKKNMKKTRTKERGGAPYQEELPTRRIMTSLAARYY